MDQKNKKVSVAIATYNGSEYIIEELISILNQTRLPDEVIISDDNSTDNTCQLVSEFIAENKLKNWKLISNEKNQGFSTNFMKTLYMCKGDYILLSDQDDIWKSNKVERLLNYVEKSDELMSISSQFNVIDGKGNIINPPKKIPNIKCDLNGNLEQIFPTSNIISSYIRGCTMMIRKEVVDYVKINKLEFFCDNHLLGHDWLLWTMASLLGDTYIIHEALMNYRVHDSNTSLEALRRETLVGSLKERIKGIEKSVAIHEYILTNKIDFKNFTNEFELICKRAIVFETKRLYFLKSSRFNFIKFLNLGVYLSLYKRYYRNYFKGIKVYIGDLIYFKKGYSNY